VPHRTIRSKGYLSNKAALAMIFKLIDAAQKSQRRLDGLNTRFWHYLDRLLVLGEPLHRIVDAIHSIYLPLAILR
jgi:hypothetical protein